MCGCDCVRYLSAGKLIEIQLKVRKLMLSFIFSKAVWLESLPGWFWAPGLIFCTRVSTGQTGTFGTFVEACLHRWCLTCGSGARIRPSWSFFKCFCCLSPAFLGCFYFFVIEVFAPCVFIGRQFLLLFLWPLLVFFVPCSEQSGFFNGMTAD